MNQESSQDIYNQHMKVIYINVEYANKTEHCRQECSASIHETEKIHPQNSGAEPMAHVLQWGLKAPKGLPSLTQAVDDKDLNYDNDGKNGKRSWESF